MYSFSRPVVFISLISILEIAFVLSFPSLIPIILVCSLIVAFVLFFSFYRKGERATAIASALLIILPMISSVYSYNVKEKRALDFAKNYSSNKDTVYSAIVTDFNSYGSYSVIFAKLSSADSQSIADNHKIRVSCYTSDKLSIGDKIIFKGTPVHVSDIQNDTFNTSTYLRGKNVFLDFEKATLLDAFPSKNQNVFLSLRAHTKDLIYDYLPENSQSASVCYAMFAGDMDYIPGDVKDAFADSGTTHILCVSGMHLTILSAVFSGILSYFTVSKKTSSILIIGFCFFYTAFTGFNLSTVRAAIMCGILYGASMFGRKTESVISLFVSAYIICTISPYSIFDLSLILSCFATLGIIITAMNTKQVGKKLRTILRSSIETAILANIGAVAFTIPVCVYFFGRINIYSVPATLSISIISEFLLISVFFLILLSPIGFFPIYEKVLHAFGYIIDGICRIIISIADFFAGLPYSVINANYGWIILAVFLFLLVLLSTFYSIGMKRCSFVTTMAIILLSASTLLSGLYVSIFEDAEYKVQYFRQNEDDRQLSIKLGTQGYLLVNADNSLCVDREKCAFDKYGGNNYLLLIPNDIIDTNILSDKIKLFDEDFGIKKIFVPETKQGQALGMELSKNGISCEYMRGKSQASDITLHFESNSDYDIICINDEKTSTAVVFSDVYSNEYFDDNYDICAFFTRKTKNQFDLVNDTAPNCDIFYTRMKKNDSKDGILNTFGQKSFYIKG